MEKTYTYKDGVMKGLEMAMKILDSTREAQNIIPGALEAPTVIAVVEIVDLLKTQIKNLRGEVYEVL